MVEAFARGDHSKLGVLVRQVTSMQVDGAALADTGLGVLFSDARFLQALVDSGSGTVAIAEGCVQRWRQQWRMEESGPLRGAVHPLGGMKV